MECVHWHVQEHDRCLLTCFPYRLNKVITCRYQVCSWMVLLPPAAQITQETGTKWRVVSLNVCPIQSGQRFYRFFFGYSSHLRVAITWMRVHVATCEGKSWSCCCQTGQRASTQSGPQAELSIGLVKLRGYRWVTKPPLITNHFCHQSLLERKGSKKVCIKQKRKVIGHAHFFCLTVLLTSPFISRVFSKRFIFWQVMFN